MIYNIPQENPEIEVTFKDGKFVYKVILRYMLIGGRVMIPVMHEKNLNKRKK